MKEVNDVNQCSRQLGPGDGSHSGASNGNKRWAALPGVATLRLTRLEVATVMLTIEAREWLYDVNKKELPQKRELRVLSLCYLLIQRACCQSGSNPRHRTLATTSARQLVMSVPTTAVTFAMVIEPSR